MNREEVEEIIYKNALEIIRLLPKKPSFTGVKIESGGLLTIESVDINVNERTDISIRIYTKGQK